MLFLLPVHNMVCISFDNILASCKIIIWVLHQRSSWISPQKWLMYHMYNKPRIITYGNYIFLCRPDINTQKWQVHTKVQSVDLKGNDRFGNLGVDRIILLQSRRFEVWIWLTLLRTTSSEVQCEYDTKLSVKGAKLLVFPGDCHPLKERSELRS